MLSQLTRCAKNLWSRLSSAANKLFRCLTEPAHPNLVTGTLADLPRRRLALLAENALLRQQLIVLRRKKTPRMTWRERLSLVILAHWVPNWKQVLQIIQPDTLVRWHREGFRLFWRLKSRRPLQTQPQRLAAETIALIQRMARENRLWGAERIRGELLKLNIQVAKRTIQKYIQAARSKPPAGQSWSTFLKTHGKDIWACDCVPVITLFFKTIHAFVIVHHESRRVVHVGVTEHPTDAWISQQLRDATPFDEKPKYFICDNDKKYGPTFERVAKASGIEVIPTPFEAPRANAICERFVGSLRRECLDHVLVIGARPLNRMLKDYVAYFNQVRPHTCTCVPVQVSGNRTRGTGVKGVTAWRAEGREGDSVPGVERAAPRLPADGRLGQCWLKQRADTRGSQHRSTARETRRRQSPRHRT